MFLSDLCGQQAANRSQEDAGYLGHSSKLIGDGSDDQLITDCRSLMCQFGTLLNDIQQAAEIDDAEQSSRQAALREADEQAFDLMGRIMVTRAITHCGMRSKHALAEFLLSTSWRDDPSPFRDRLLLSFVLDAARLDYPAASVNQLSTVEDLATTRAVIDLTNACLTIFQELAAAFQEKDKGDLQNPAEQEAVDASIIVLKDRKNKIVAALTGFCASSTAAINAKRIVLRRMLEAGMGSCEAHHLRVELARSYVRDLNTYLQIDEQEHQALSASSGIWNSLSNSFRWLTSTVHLR